MLLERWSYTRVQSCPSNKLEDRTARCGPEKHESTSLVNIDSAELVYVQGGKQASATGKWCYWEGAGHRPDSLQARLSDTSPHVD
ncbi:unnamed protein product [Dibothriocephalus latus]|uniref:Uncharacterized protein n=1 Tax=Dibothriocephalus latus TaxID=60516 RepID=A0A3P7PCR7_DIBLA|nr:unnamed protein product [Dibothriocephalus latus]